MIQAFFSLLDTLDLKYAESNLMCHLRTVRKSIKMRWAKENADPRGALERLTQAADSSNATDQRASPEYAFSYSRAPARARGSRRRNESERESHTFYYLAFGVKVCVRALLDPGGTLNLRLTVWLKR